MGTASERVLGPQGAGEGEVYWVAVSPASRGLGVGAALTSAVLAGLAQAGLARARLDTQDERLTAITMYMRFGFIPGPRSAVEEAAWSRIVSVVAGRRAVDCSRVSQAGAGREGPVTQ